MRTRHLATAGTALLLLALLVLPAGASAAPGPARAAQAGPGISILATTFDLLYPGSAQISGRLFGSEGGDAGDSLVLLADTAPFGTLVPVASTTTQPDGSYTFSVKPAFNTLYQVVSQDATIKSPGRIIFVDPLVGGRVFSNARLRTVTLLHRVSGPPSMRVARQVVYYYFRAYGRPLYARVAASCCLRLIRPGVIEVRRTIPAPTVSGEYASCTVRPPVLSMTRPGRLVDCGRLRVPASFF